MLKNVKFEASVYEFNKLIKTDKPQIVLVGKSNVGKSSFINAISNQKKLAKVGQTPGKTRSINYYNVNNCIIHSEAELKDFINNALNSGNTTFTFRTEGYSIASVDIIKYYTSNKGFYTLNVSGEYGKESTYNVTLK